MRVVCGDNSLDKMRLLHEYAEAHDYKPITLEKTTMEMLQPIHHNLLRYMEHLQSEPKKFKDAMWQINHNRKRQARRKLANASRKVNHRSH